MIPIDMVCYYGVQATGILLYGCGPNVIVGAVATPIFGVKSIVYKIKKVSAEKIVANAKNDIERKKALKNVQVIDRSLNRSLHSLTLFAFNTIPVLGPFIALDMI